MKRNHAFCLSALALTLSACGGGDGGEPTLGNTDTGAPPATYSFYEGSLTAFDPENPGVPIPVEAGSVEGAIAVVGANYSAATGTFSGIHTHSVIYATGGKLYQVSALKTGGLTPVQVSSEGGANKICDERVDPDFANPDNSAYVYDLPGGDGICGNGDDQRKMVTLGMSAAQAPVDVPASTVSSLEDAFITLNDPATGARIGYLGLVGGGVFRYDASFANPVTLSLSGRSLSGTNWNRVNFLFFDRIFFTIDHPGGGSLYAYDVATQRLSLPLFMSASPLVNQLSARQDATHLFLKTNSAIYRLPRNADDFTDPTQLAVVDSGRVKDLELTSSKVTFVVEDGTSNTLKTVHKNASGVETPYTYFSVPKTSAQFLELFETAGDWVYFNSKNIDGGWDQPIAAGTVKVDVDALSNFTQRAGAYWCGSLVAPTYNPGATATYVQKLIRAEGYNASLGFGGATVQVYEATGNTELTTLGTLPPNTIPYIAGLWGQGNEVGGTVYVDSGSGMMGEVFFGRADVPGSLSNLTNTGNKNEWYLD